MLLYLLAVSKGLWVYLGPVLAGLGGLIAGAAAAWGQRSKSKADKVDYHNSLLEAMQGHLTYMSDENKSQRQRIDDLTAQVLRCQNDKYQMQADLEEWKRKWEERLSGTNNPTP